MWLAPPLPVVLQQVLTCTVYYLLFCYAIKCLKTEETHLWYYDRTLNFRSFLSFCCQSQRRSQNGSFQHYNVSDSYGDHPLPNASIPVHPKCCIVCHHSNSSNWPHRHPSCLPDMEDRQIWFCCDVCILWCYFCHCPGRPCHCGAVSFQVLDNGTRTKPVQAWKSKQELPIKWFLLSCYWWYKTTMMLLMNR